MSEHAVLRQEARNARRDIHPNRGHDAGKEDGLEEAAGLWRGFDNCGVWTQARLAGLEADGSWNFAEGAEAGLPAPRVEEEDGYFRVTFFRKRAEGDAATPFRDPNDLNDPNDPNQSDSANGVKALSGHEDSPLAVKLLSMVEARPNTTYQTLGEMCGVSPATVKRALKKLKEEGKLRRVGGTRGSWVVVK